MSHLNTTEMRFYSRISHFLVWCALTVDPPPTTAMKQHVIHPVSAAIDAAAIDARSNDLCIKCLEDGLGSSNGIYYDDLSSSIEDIVSCLVFRCRS